MASKPFSFRLPPDLVAIVEERRKEGETSNQALQREVIAYLSSGIEASSSQDSLLGEELTGIVDRRIDDVMQRIEALEGKLSA